MSKELGVNEGDYAYVLLHSISVYPHVTVIFILLLQLRNKKIARITHFTLHSLFIYFDCIYALAFVLCMSAFVLCMSAF